MSVIKRRRNHGLVGGCIIGGGVATIVTVVLTVSGVFGATAAPRVGGVIPASAIAQLTSIAAQQAAINGDASPTSVLAVEATHAAALTVATPGDVLPQSAASEAVYLITMTGSFIGNGFSTAPGSPAPMGSYLSVVVDSGTFWVTDEGLSQSAPPVSPSSLGPTTTLAVGTTSS